MSTTKRRKLLRRRLLTTAGAVLCVVLLAKGETDMLTQAEEKLILKWTIAQEAEAEPFDGKLAVGWVVMNRVRQFRQSVSDVCFAPWQFTAWNTDSPTRKRLDDIGPEAMDASRLAAEQAYHGTGSDPSQGATHYLNPVVTRRLREKAGKGLTLPDWVEKMTLTAVIGRHHFYK